MRFANIYYGKRNDRATLGDDMQLLAIENMYKNIGVDYNDVVRVEWSDLATYDGEEVILPISFPIISYGRDDIITCFSEKITPVFLGLCVLITKLSDKDVEYLKKYEPIGCRDQHTYETMVRHGIDAYVGGCMTLTFDRRKNEKGTGKIYAVDITDNLRHVIPEELQKKSIFTSHSYYVSQLDTSPEEKARAVYEDYRDNADLIITSRMHAALPCAAAGIPVVFYKDVYSYRFCGIDGIVDIYDEPVYDQICWNPAPYDYEDTKKLMLTVAKKRLYSEDCKEEIQKLHGIMTRKKHPNAYIEFVDNTTSFIDQKWNREDAFQFSVWGITQLATCVVEYIKENFPNAQFVAAVDKFKRFSFYGLDTAPKEELEKFPEAFTFICTGAAIHEANEYLGAKLNREYYQCCADNVVLPEDEAK